MEEKQWRYFQIQVSCKLGKGRVGGQGCENAKVFESSQVLATLLQILRSRNTHADSLTTLATSSVQSLLQVILVEDLCKPTKVRREIVQIHQIRVGLSWMDFIVQFLKEDILLEGKAEVDKVRKKAPRFWLFEGQKLYKRSSSRTYLLCIHS